MCSAVFMGMLCLFLFSCHQEKKGTRLTDNQDRIIKVNAVVNCSVNTAFNYFIDNNLLSKWLAVTADVELIEGGKYELFWSPENLDPTNNSTYGCKVLAFERPHYLMFEWRGNADQKMFMNNVRPLTMVTVLFTSLGEKKTKITLLHTGWRQGTEWEAAREHFIKAWAAALNQLESILLL